MVTTDTQVAQLKILSAMCEALMELGRVPDGHLYARVMGHFRDLAAYNSYIDMLCRTDLVKREGHELVWNGPKLK